MEAKAYKTKSGITRYKAIADADEICGDDSLGFCIGCGTDTSGVEPDARKYPCDNCDAPLVYGLEELLMMGLAEVSGRDE